MDGGAATQSTLCAKLDGVVRVDGNLQIDNNPLLTTLTCLAKLQVVTGYLAVKNNAALTSAIFPALITVGTTFSFRSNQRLATMEANKLASAGAVTIMYHDSMTSLQLNLLAHVNAGRFYLYRAAKLEDITLPNLIDISADLEITNNLRLKTVRMANLKEVGM